jgi:hypothetical protein
VGDKLRTDLHDISQVPPSEIDHVRPEVTDDARTSTVVEAPTVVGIQRVVALHDEAGIAATADASSGQQLRCLPM